MEKITLNGKLYVAVGDVDNLCHNLCKDVIDSYERGDDGMIHMSEMDMDRTAAYRRVIHEIMHDEICAAETPDEIRALHDRLRKEWMRDKYVIVGNDMGENVFFRKMCGEEEDTPAFTSKIRYAKTYGDHYNAHVMALWLEQQFDLETKVEPLYLFAMTNAEAKKMLDAILKKDDDMDGEGESE